MEKDELTKFHSLPNIQANVASGDDLRNLYSLSLSQIRKRSDFGQYGYKPSPFVRSHILLLRNKQIRKPP